MLLNKQTCYGELFTDRGILTYCKYTKILETDILVKSFNDTLIKNSFKILIDKPTKISTSSATHSDFMIICKFELKQVIVCQRVQKFFAINDAEMILTRCKICKKIMQKLCICNPKIFLFKKKSKIKFLLFSSLVPVKV